MYLDVKVKLLNKNAKIPNKQTENSSGYDIYSSEDVILNPGETKLIHTGISCEIPPGFEIQIRPRSGLALKHSISILNTPGTIDADYRGEIGVILHNFGQSPFKIRKNDRIAQMVLSEVKSIKFHIVNFLSETNRGSGGFGSTGKQ